jgi:ubiquitin C-terminal hydrolase
MLKAINDLFLSIELKKKKSGIIDPKKFISSVKKNNQEFNNEDHHDSHEFLIWLLDSLNENIKIESKKMKNDSETATPVSNSEFMCRLSFQKPLKENRAVSSNA